MKRMIKRWFDVILSSFLIIVLSPLLITIYLLVILKIGKPALFTQKRPGEHGRVFKLYKFRSMTSTKDKNGNLLPDSERLTDFGIVLRKTSLDELPELFNILKGDMSFVGPRPLLVQYLQRYNKRQARRHEVKPGLTGWAQINGRNSLSWEEKFELDVWYVDHWNLWLDFKILLKTIIVVFRKTGISSEGETTMNEFMGNSEE